MCTIREWPASPTCVRINAGASGQQARETNINSVPVLSTKLPLFTTHTDSHAEETTPDVSRAM